MLDERDKPMDIREYHFDPPICAVSTAFVSTIDSGLYDLFDQHGNCWNEGCPIPFIPTKRQVKELILTGEIKSKIERIEG